MARRKLIWKVYPYYLAIIVVSLIATAFYASREMRRTYLDEVRRDLETKATLINPRIVEFISRENHSDLESFVQSRGMASGTRITVVDTSGLVLADSEKDPATMENHKLRPEISKALSGRVGSKTRMSNTLQKSMIYVAVPIIQGDAIIGALRTSRPEGVIKDELESLNFRIFLAGLFLTGLATIVSLVIFRRISKPLAELRDGADRIASGETNVRLAPSDSEEIGSLTEAMNNMSVQLSSRIDTITKQRNERAAILASMSEGLIALDAQDLIIAMNEAAGKLLGVDSPSTIGKDIRTIARNNDLFDILQKTRNSNQTVSGELLLYQNGDKYVLVHGTQLTDAEDNRIGILLVLTDVTRMRTLESVRRDFVANVSHELRTPITAIVAAAETLLDSETNLHPDAAKIAGIISRHSNRMGNLVSDLLYLARLENDESKPETNTELCNIFDMLESSKQACEHKAKAKQVSIKMPEDARLVAEVMPTKLEQAIINLLDNAIKYSPENSVIELSATQVENEIIISVTDLGSGIAQRHLSRLFERFYRVDSARSREIGGTGLGLAIVKHIALAHGGRVSVSSKTGEGSTFRIHLPIPTA